MKRSLMVLLVIGLIAGSVTTAEAKRRKQPLRVERTVEGSYGPLPAPVTGCNEPLGTWACLIVETRPTESFFTAKVTDVHGQPVFVEVRSGGWLVAVFCGETTKPIAFNGGSPLEFHVALNNWLVSTDCPAHRIKTTGTINLTLSNAP